MTANKIARTQILTSEQVNAKLHRIAFQILENRYADGRIVLLGINGSGETLAGILAHILKDNGLNCAVGSVKVDKANPLSYPITYSLKVEELKDATVLFVDDVANSGRTLFYALEPLMHSSVKGVEVAVLIDREHKQFPITADYVGLSLSTGLQEHISVEPAGKDSFEAYLS